LKRSAHDKKPLPRNLVSVRDLVGDSTMTSDFGGPLRAGASPSPSSSAAALRAGLKDGDYGRRYFQPEQSILERLTGEIGTGAVRAAARLGLGPAVSVLSGARGGVAGPILARLDREVDRELQLLSRFNDPRGIYLHCFCVID